MVCIKYFGLYLWSVSSTLVCIKYFGLPVSVNCPVYRIVNDEDYLPLVSASKRRTSVFVVLESLSHEPNTYRTVPVTTENFSVTARNESLVFFCVH